MINLNESLTDINNILKLKESDHIKEDKMVNETQGLIALGTFTTIVALIPILMNIFMKAPKKKIKK